MRFFLSLLLIFQVNLTHATLNDVDKAILVPLNILQNPGFENGKSKWTASGGTFTTVTSGTNLLTGLVSATWDSSSASQTLTSTALTIPKGLYGKNGLAYCNIQVPSGTATHTLQVYDGTNILVSTTITSSTLPTRTSVNYIHPTSGSLSLRLVSVASNESLIAIDDCYLGDAANISNVSQAQFVGKAVIAGTASCDWARTSSTFGAFTSTAACPGPTVQSNPGPGTIQTTDANLPRFTVNSLPPGQYRVVITGYGGTTGASNASAYTISDGTTTNGRGFAESVSTAASQFSVEAFFSYSTSGNISFELFGASPAQTVNVYNSNALYGVEFIIYRYPLSSEQAFTADTVAWKLDLNISGANPDLGVAVQSAYIAPNNASLTMTVNTLKGSAPAGISCSSTNDNSVGSTTCSAGSEELGFVANFPRAGLVEVCHYFNHYLSLGINGDVDATFQIVRTANGSQTIAEEGGARQSSRGRTNSLITNWPVTICGTFQIPNAAKHTIRLMYEQTVASTINSNLIMADALASNGQRDVKITARYIDQNFPAPMIRNSVVTSSSGVTGTEVAKLRCFSSSSIISQLGSWVSSIGNVSTGACTVTIAAGTFSATPYCQANISDAGFASTSASLNVIESSATSISVDCEAGGACTDYDFNLHCQGPK